MLEMFEIVKDVMESYQKKHEKDDSMFSQHEEYCSLELLKDLIEQNIKK